MAKSSSAPSKAKSPAKPPSTAARPLRPRAAPNGVRGGNSRPAPRAASAQYATSGLEILAILLAALLCLCAPLLLCGFSATDYVYEPQALWLGTVAVIAVLLVAAQRPLDGISPIGALLLAFFVWCAASVFGAVYWHDALLEIGRLLGLVAWFFLVRTLVGRGWATLPLIVATVAGAVWTASGALWNFYVTQYPRQSGGFLNPNLFATWGAMALPFALALMVEWGRRIRWLEWTKWLALLSGVFTLLIAGGLAVTSSKGGFLAALCGLAVFAASVLRARGRQVVIVARRNAPIIVPLVIVLLVAGGAVAAKTVLPRLMAARGSDDNSTMFRLYTWRGTWAMTQARPLLGWGAGDFSSAYPQFAQTGDTRSAHQSWLQIASECGLLAPLLLFGAGGVAMVRGWRSLKTRPDWPLAAGALGAITALLVHGFTDDPWKVIATSALGMLSLALLDGAVQQEPQAQAQVKGTSRQLRVSTLSFLPLALCLLVAAWWTSRAAGAVGLWQQAQQQVNAGAPAFALQQVNDAVATMPLSARAQTVRAWCLEGNGDTSGARAAYERAAQLQPTSAAHPFGLARLLVQDLPNETATIAQNFDRAVSLAPNDPNILLARGQWRLDHKDTQGWNDYQRVSDLADAPYGRYPAIGQDVNLDFDRAFLKLATRAKGAARQKLLSRVRADITRARTPDAMVIYQAQAQFGGDPRAVDDRKAEIKEIEQGIGLTNHP